MSRNPITSDMRVGVLWGDRLLSAHERTSPLKQSERCRDLGAYSVANIEAARGEPKP
jgi:hypothetical protein